MKRFKTYTLYSLLVLVFLTGCKEDKFTIEQTYFAGKHKTYVWVYYMDIAASWSIHQDSVSCDKIKENFDKAQDWIDGNVNCE